MSVQSTSTNNFEFNLQKYEGEEISSPLRDASCGKSAEKGRWVIALSAFPHSNDVAACIAAWHAMLQWLRYDDEAVVTCTLNAERTQVLPLASEINSDTTLDELYSIIKCQYSDANPNWQDLNNFEKSSLFDHLKCHAIWLQGKIIGDASPAADLELIFNGKTWVMDAEKSVFGLAYLEHLSKFWQQLIKTLFTDPAQSISDQVLFEYDANSNDASGNITQLKGNLADRFNRKCLENAEKTAIIDSDSEISFSKLEQITDALAAELQSRGLDNGDVVALAFERNAKMAIAQLTSFKLGTVFVPLDPELPAERLSAMMDDANVKCLITEEALATSIQEKLPKLDCLVVDQIISENIKSESSAKTFSATHTITQNDPAYIIFTSGSTGMPKGVKVSHGNLLNFIVHFELDNYVVAEDVVSQFAPFSFDAAVAEINATLLNGCTLVILSKALINSPPDLQAYLSKHKVTFSVFPPQYLQYLSPENMPHLRTLVTAGSAPNYDLLSKWMPHVRYINAYGPTETTVLSTAWEADKLPEPEEPIAMGKPIINTKVRIVNRFGQTLPKGVTGELVIGGAGVAQGYINREDLNGEKFFNDDNSSWYKSGDLANFNQKMELIFNGRIDDQIKLRGHRLEPGEVESAVSSIPAVELAATVVHKTDGNVKLVLFLQGQAMDESELREELQSRLPHWAMPNRIFWMDALPINTNGKIDYKKLRAIAAEDKSCENNIEVAENSYTDELEAKVAKIWCDVLQQSNIKPDDNFLFLGGDSLTALVVVSSLRNLGYAISSSNLLAQPKFSEFVAELKKTGTSLQRNYDAVTGTAPITPIQAWYFSQGLENPQRFCQSLVFDVPDVVLVDQLQEAVEKLVDYHDQLRVRFEKRDGQWLQLIEKNHIEVPAIEFIAFNAESKKQLDDVTTQIQNHLADDFNLDQAPLFRMALLPTNEGTRVIWVIHHLLVDTISHSILLNDLQALYQNSHAPVNEVLPGKSVSYFAWAEKLQSQIDENAINLLGLWQNQIEQSVKALPLPLNEGLSQQLDIELLEFDKDITKKLLEFAPNCYHQSPEELLLATVYLALAKTFDLSIVGIDVEWHGRDEDFINGGLERTVGWFTSVHPLFLNVPSSNLTREALGHFLCALKETRNAIPSRGRDFYGLKFCTKNPDVKAAFEQYRAPQVMFNFSGVVQRSSNLWKTQAVAAIEMGEGNQNPYKLSVESEIRNGQLQMGLYLDENIWNPEHISSFKENARELLQQVITHCCDINNRRWTASDFPLLSLGKKDLEQLPHDVTAAFPLTDMQQTLYRHKDIYQVVMHYQFPRSWNHEAFAKAFNNWINHNDCLRTVIYPYGEDQVAQIILAELIAEFDVQSCSGAELEKAINEKIEQERKEDVVFANTPPWSLTVFENAGEQFSVVLSIHHIIHDGWTINLLFDSLFRFYRAQLAEINAVPEKAKLNLQDLLEEQRRISADEASQQYWASVEWADNYCQLPEKSSACQSQDAGETELYIAELPEALVAKLKQQALQLGVTFNSVLLSGFVGLLRFLGGCHQVRCGVIQSGRPENLDGIDAVTGCCVNTLPLVLDFKADVEISHLLTDVHHKLSQLTQFAAYPLSKIYQECKQKTAGNLFDCLFNIESAGYGSNSSDAMPELKGGFESTNYSFIFGIIEQLGGSGEKLYGLRIGYDTTRYDSEKIERWVNIYTNILQQFNLSLDKAWSEISPLPTAELGKITYWNDTRVPYPSDVLLADHFAQAVQLNPDKTALAFKDIKLTYAELDKKTDHLARLLASKGVGPEVVVGLVAERSLEMVLGILAVIKSGGAYVPIDPKYPADRVNHILDELNCELVLLQKSEFKTTIPADKNPELILIDDEKHAALDLPAVDSSQHHTRQLAYVMYTSGSTGKPKGVMIEQRSIVRLIKNSQDVLFSKDDCILITSAPGFDVTTYEMWSALLNGLTLAGIDEDTLLDPQALAREIRDKKVSFLWVVAPLFNQLVQEKPDLFAGVKRIMIGGDALSPWHINLAREHSPGLEFINGYGPTENTSFSTYHFLSDEDHEIIPIGRPITNSTCYVVNADGHLLPPGVKGELYVGGPGVARGYYERPELNAEKFVTDRYFGDNDKLYRTGDLVGWRENGLIDFYGRIDFQIKIRGFRVELGEIETVILQAAAVKQALVLAKPFAGQKRLVAYLVPELFTQCDSEQGSGEQKNSEQSKAFADDLKTKLQAELPDYMVPEQIVLLEAMPLNANGKIDRARLPEPQFTSADESRASAANETEQVLWDVWSEVLGSDQFGVTDNFLSIGGDSIIAIQVVSRAQKRGLMLNTRTLLQQGNIRAIAASLATSDATTQATENEQCAIEGEQRLLPIHLDFLQRDAVDVHHYNQSVWVQLNRKINCEQLAKVFSALIERHDALRLRFRQTPAGWLARYNNELLNNHSAVRALVTELDLRGLDAEVAFETERQNIADLQASLDLKKGITAKWLVVRSNEGDKLFWTQHHLVVDGISWRVLLEDFASALEQIDSVEIHLPAKTSSYQAWASKLYDFGHGDTIQAEKPFLLAQLAHSQALPVKSQTIEDNSEAQSAQIHFEFSETTTQKLLTQSHQCYQTTVNDLLLAALSQALNTWADIKHFRIDLEGHGREALFDELDLSGTVGWFTSIFPLHLEHVEGDLGQLILATKQHLQALPNNGIGFGILNHLAQDEDLMDALEDQAQSELVFNYLGQLDAANRGLNFDMATDELSVSPRRQRRHTLGLNGFVKDSCLQFSLDYNRNMFAESALKDFVNAYCEAIEAIVEHCTGGAKNGGEVPHFEMQALSIQQYQDLLSRYPGIADLYPATAMQQGLVLYTQREEGSGAYITQLRFELQNLDKNRFQQAWELLVARHPILRTAFADLGGAQLTQVVNKEAALEFKVEECSKCQGESDAEHKQRAEQLLEQNRTLVFNPEQAPLMRILVVDLDDTRSLVGWTHHHALLDGWSMGLVVRDLFTAYTELANTPKEQVLADEAPAYKDYIRWLQGQDHNTARQYWTQFLSGVESGTQLSRASQLSSGTELSKATEPKSLGSQKACEMQISASNTKKLQEHLRAAGFTLSSLLQAAWSLLLSKHSGDEEVVFGYAVNGRPADLSGVENMLGLFINSLPMRVALSTEQSVKELIDDVQKRQFESEPHSYVALGDIQKWLGLRADQALFESLVVLENYPLDKSQLNSSNPDALQVLDIDGVEQNDFALNLVIYPGESLKVKLVYQTQLFSTDEAQALLQQYCTLLENMGDGPEPWHKRKLSTLSLMTQAQQEKALLDWNQSDLAIAEDENIYAAFEAQVAKSPDATAIVMGDTRLSFVELEQWVAEMANWLASEGVQAGSRVAICLPKSPELVCSILAVIKLGAAYIPIATDCPKDRLTFIAEDAEIQALLGSNDQAALFQDLQATVLFLEQLEISVPAVAAARIFDPASHLAYVIYTSGTTGRPKGVAISHRNLINFCRWCVVDQWMGPGTRASQFAPYTFDASVGETFAALLSGAELHLLGEELIQSPKAVSRYLLENEILFAAFPPPYLQQVNFDGLSKDFTLVTAGSAPNLEAVKHWGETCRYINAYGPTETTILSSCWHYDPEVLAKGRLPIGKPVCNTQLYIVDQFGQLCPPGVTGEILIGGSGVALGYINRAELTTKHFVEDRWREQNRVYRTGDMGYWLEDGSIEFVGRRDNQVKIRGYRIELAGIEYQLRQLNQVDQAVVLAKGEDANKQLLAWVVPCHTVEDSARVEFVKGLRSSLRQVLAEYMVPQGFMLVDSLPLTANGKVDNKALLAADIDPIYEGGFKAPSTELEKQLAAIWAKLLNMDADKLSVNANFFDVGGHSLLAMRLVSELSQQLGVCISVRDVFSQSTLAELAEFIEQQPANSLAPIVPVDRQQALPLSFAQQRLWFIDQLEKGSSQYNVPLYLDVRGPLDVSALQNALDQLVARHEVLRTAFVSNDGDEQQVIHSERAVNLILTDLSSKPEDQRNQTLQQIVAEEAARPFNLSDDLMIRAQLLQLEAEHFALLITLHHIASDGWSLSILTRELKALYGANCQNRSADLPPLPVQYADYAFWQRQHLQGEGLDKDLAYWKQQLNALPAVHALPLDFKRPAEQSYQGAVFSHRLDTELTQQLRSLAQGQKATLFMVLNAAFACLLNRYSGEADVVVGTTTANREQGEIAGLIGFFVNTLILRNNVQPGMPFSDLLAQCREHTLDAYAHQQMPFDLLVEELQPERALSYNPLFQIMLSMENIDSTRAINLGEAELAVINSDAPIQSQFDLTLDVAEAPDHLEFRWTYATDLFKHETIARMAEHFHSILSKAVNSPNAALHQITRLPETQRQFVLQACNDSDDPALFANTWPQLFAKQAQQNPNKIAVQCGDRALSYQQLEQQSRAFAEQLSLRGIGLESIVALLDHRGVDLLVAIVGVLRAGGAYLPLDPNHPSDRWLEILKEGKPSLLVVGDDLTEECLGLQGLWQGPCLQMSDVALSNKEGTASNVQLPMPSLDNLAYVIYTSGSTGKPKGVMIEHRGMINNMLSKVEPLGLTDTDVIAQTASQCFDISVWQFLTAPILGATVAIFDSQTVQDPQALLMGLANQKVTVWEPVPSVIQAALAVKFALPQMRWVLPTGEALSASLVARWFEQYPKVPLMNAYGPAECSDDVAFQPIYEAVERVLIGKPVANAHLHVVDSQLELLPIGAVGELAISGPVVGRGYLHAPELTEAVFKENPYARDELDRRLYLTGDLVRRTETGALEFVGRKDFQVKIRGYRIELGEIESRLNALPGVKEAVVLTQENKQGDAQLVAYFLTEQSGDQTVSNVEDDALRAALRSQLPDYMVPAAFIAMEEFPLTPNGKLNRKALPKPDFEALVARNYVAPEGELETIIAECWQDVLQLERVGRFDNFFTLGGHSLLIMRVIENLRKHGHNASVRQIFDAEHLADLAQRLSEGGDELNFVAPANKIPELCDRITPQMLPLVALNQEQIDRVASLAEGGHANIQDIYPLTPLQEGILFDHLVSDVGDTYLASVLLGFDSREGLDHYLSVLQKLVDRYDTLRTYLVWEDLPKAVQVVQRKAPISVQEIQVERSEDILATFDKMMAQDNRQIDLQKAPILGLYTAYDAANDKWVLLQQQHHLTCDQVSMEIQFRDTLALFKEEADNLPAPVPYREFVAQTLWRSQAFDVEAYFRKILAGIDEPTAPFGLLEVYRGDKVTEEVEHHLGNELATRLRNQTKKYGVTPAALFHLAWALVLARCCNRDDVVFGTVTSGRLQGTEGVDRTYGLFINMLPIRIQLSNRSVSEALLQTRNRLIELINYEHAPLVEVQRCSDLPGSTPLFSAILNFRHEAGSAVDIERMFEGVEVLQSPGDISNYLFDMSISDTGEGFHLTASIDSTIGAERVMSYMRRALSEVTAALEAEPERQLLSLPVISNEEQQQLLTEFNQPLQRELISATWPQYFAAQVKKTPLDIAAVCDDQSLTYEELDRLSDHLARALQNSGIGRGSIVGLLDNRGLELLVMISSVLKAGAAYLPLDPSQPSKRWLEILQDSKPDLLIMGSGFAGELRWLRRKWKGANIETYQDLMDKPVNSDVTLPTPTLDDLAYVIFTSGSTGKPKGVMIEHRGMINNMLSKVEPLGMSSDDVIAQTASQCFDISVWQFLMAPIIGGRVVIVTNETTRDPNELLSCLARNKVSVWEPVPSVMQAILPLGQALPDLRWVLPTGEALLAPLVDRWFKQYPNVPLMNAYGPAECSDDVCFQPMHGPVERVFIGKPVANARLHVVDNHLSLLPVGVVGELAISGPVVGRGYLHQAELTDKVFKANPYAQDELDTRLYLTGDLVKRHGDGNLEYMGRKDFQVKIRGFRIELGEIESRLAQHPMIKEAVVIARENAQGDKYLAAYLTYRAQALSNDQLKTHLAAELPDYMVPGVYVTLEAMPLNNNGKIDRKALPEPSSNELLVQEYEAPEGDIETKISEVWRNLLNLEQVGRNDNFFDLGGNSILIIRMLSELKAVGVELRANDVYQHRILRQCAACVAQSKIALSDWLNNGIEHQIVSFDFEGKNQRCLLIDKQHINERSELQAVLATESKELIPEYIRFVDNVRAEAGKIKQISDVPSIQKHKLNRFEKDIPKQSMIFAKAISSAETEGDFRFSPIQVEMSQWTNREHFEWVAVNGLYSDRELQQASMQLIREQDLMRSVPAANSKQWHLKNVDGIQASIPVVDCRGNSDKACEKLLRKMTGKLQKQLKDAGVFWLGFWVRRTDTLQQLLIVDDHLITDGSSAAVLQQRMEVLLAGNAQPTQTTYRDYIQAVWRNSDQAVRDFVSDHLELKNVSGTLQGTFDALERRKSKPVRSCLIEIPLNGESSPVEQAFDHFKKWVLHLLSAEQFVMVMNHYGRQLGNTSYFDQFGLFLDKIPFVVNEGTQAHLLSNKLDTLVKNGINYLALKQSAGKALENTMPGISHEILFNFEGEIGESDSMQEKLFEQDMSAKLKRFFGVLFEAQMHNDKLVVHCAFRGTKQEEKEITKVIPAKLFNLKTDTLSAVEPELNPTANRPVSCVTSQEQSNMGYAIEAKNVRKQYGKFEAVKGVSFKVRRGICFGILGPNGAGKTSLLGMIEGITPISEGTISVLDLDVKTQIKKIQPHIGVQLQQNNYFEFLTVEQLLKFYKELRSANKRKVAAESVDELLSKLNLQDKKSFKVDELSGGQKQRLSIAIALLENPDILFLDEPTSALDPHSRHEVWRFIEQLKQDKTKTIILTTHYMEEAETLCDEIMIMSEGKIISQGSPLELINNLCLHHDIQLQFGRGQFHTDYLMELSDVVDYTWENNVNQLTVKTSKFTDTLKELLSISETRGIEIVNFNINRPDLEDVFLTSTKKDLVE